MTWIKTAFSFSCADEMKLINSRVIVCGFCLVKFSYLKIAKINKLTFQVELKNKLTKKTILMTTNLP